MCQFTSPTTCYSSVKRKQKQLVGDEEGQGQRKDDAVVEFRLATENHLIQVKCDVPALLSISSTADDDDKNKNTNDTWKINAKDIPRDTNSIICVGYSQHDEYPDNIEALTLLDPPLLPEHQRLAVEPPTIPLFDPSQMNNNNNINNQQQPQNQDDNVSVISSSLASTSLQSLSVSQPISSKVPSTISRHASTESLLTDTMTVDGGATTATGSNVIATTADSHSNMSSDGQPLTTTKPPVGRVVLRSKPREYVALVDFSPLCPCVARFSSSKGSSLENDNADEYNISDDDNEESQSTRIMDIGVWVGSSNDTILRLFVPDQDGDAQLVQHRLDSYPEFSFMTSILAIDYFYDDGGYRQSDVEQQNGAAGAGGGHSTLAVACQDGTICLIIWEEGLEFKNIQSTTVIVDGPIVTLQLSPLRRRGRSKASGRRLLQVLVGSLCGYVCRLVEHDVVLVTDTGTNTAKDNADGNEDKKDDYDRELARKRSRWGGPFMVVQGYWNHSIDLEDSVLVVHAVPKYNMVAIGTLAGRCILYKGIKSSHPAPYNPNRSGWRYRKIWECVLPYPIHGIAALQLPLQQQRCFNLLVTTKRSIHWFQATGNSEPYEKLLQMDEDDEEEPEITIGGLTEEGMRSTNEMKKVDQANYSAATAKERLLALLQRQTTAQSSNSHHEDLTEPSTTGVSSSEKDETNIGDSIDAGRSTTESTTSEMEDHHQDTHEQSQERGEDDDNDNSMHAIPESAEEEVEEDNNDHGSSQPNVQDAKEEQKEEIVTIEQQKNDDE